MQRRDKRGENWKRSKQTVCVCAYFKILSMLYSCISMHWHHLFFLSIWSVALKEKGNKAFALRDYELAVKEYTKGLEQLRDLPALYTNRAQVLNAIPFVKHHLNSCAACIKWLKAQWWYVANACLLMALHPAGPYQAEEVWGGYKWLWMGPKGKCISE